MPDIDEVWVRKRAHEIWEAEGRPDGKEIDHWYVAAAEFRSLPPEPVKKSAPKKTVAARGRAAAVAAGDVPPEEPAAKKPVRKKAATEKKVKA